LQSTIRRRKLTRLEDVLNLALEIGEVKRFFNETADPLELKERLHGRPCTSKHYNGSLSNARLFLKIIVAIRAEFAKIGQSVLSFRDANIKKHAIGLTLFGPLKTLGPIESRQNLITQKLELLFDYLTDIILVIDNKKTFFALWHLGLDKGFKYQNYCQEHLRNK